MAASALKKGIVEILSWVDAQKNAYTELNKKKKQTKDKFKIGG